MPFTRPDPQNNLSRENYARYLELDRLFAANGDVYTASPTPEQQKEYNDLLELAKIPSGGRRTKSSKKRPTARRRRRSSKVRNARKARTTRLR